MDMAHCLTTCRRITRGVLGVLLALHLGVAQAVMVPAPQATQAPVAGAAADADLVADAMETSPCHHAGAAETGAPVTHSDGHCCDAGQCHCPIFMAADVSFLPQGLRVARDSTPMPDLAAAPSQRLVPELRPPITA
jgi:hypothetical protein